MLLAPNAQCKGWKLVVTGHSLGAGCAFLIALYLRNGICPGVRCWAFSPPGGLASAPLGDAARAWCTTIVCGREWIPRLSARSFDRLRDDMVSAALRCRLPKLAFMAGVLRGRAWAEAELVRPEVAGEDCLAVQEEYLSSLARGRDIAGHFYQHSADYTVPGRILHLKSIGSASKRRLREQVTRVVNVIPSWGVGREDCVLHVHGGIISRHSMVLRPYTSLLLPENPRHSYYLTSRYEILHTNDQRPHCIEP